MTLGQLKFLVLTLVMVAEVAEAEAEAVAEAETAKEVSRRCRGGGGGPKRSIFQRKSTDGQRQMVSDHLTTKMHKLTKFPTDKLPQINKSQLEKIKLKQNVSENLGKIKAGLIEIKRTRWSDARSGANKQRKLTMARVWPNVKLHF